MTLSLIVIIYASTSCVLATVCCVIDAFSSSIADNEVITSSTLFLFLSFTSLTNVFFMVSKINSKAALILSLALLKASISPWQFPDKLTVS